MQNAVRMHSSLGGLEPLPMEKFITEVLRNSISDTLRPSQCVIIISHFFNVGGLTKPFEPLPPPPHPP